MCIELVLPQKKFILFVPAGTKPHTALHFRKLIQICIC